MKTVCICVFGAMVAVFAVGCDESSDNTGTLTIEVVNAQEGQVFWYSVVSGDTASMTMMYGMEALGYGTFTVGADGTGRAVAVSQPDGTGEEVLFDNTNYRLAHILDNPPLFENPIENDPMFNLSAGDCGGSYDFVVDGDSELTLDATTDMSWNN